MSFTLSISWPSWAAIRSLASWAGREVSALGRRLVADVVAWNEAARLRHLARTLDDRTLRDIGISRADLDRACSDIRDWRHY